MTLEELMQFAPKDCQPTILDNKRDYQNALEEVAKMKNKKIEDLTSEDRKEALGRIGLCDLDFLIP